ncbi:MAG: Uncharacterised protein [Owenweeksia sp. TMED14]|nr:MAG: Uncharacterised protein [Owenweeksia sp. TMED14]
MIGNEFSSWEIKHIDIQDNACLSCHRLESINAWNLYIPTVNPVSISKDYQFIKDYMKNLGPFEIDTNGADVPCE